MSSTRRVARLNTLLREVISEVISKDVKEHYISGLVTVTDVLVTKDLRYATVMITILGADKNANTLDVLNKASGFIARCASKKVCMRYFPALTFKLDESIDKHMRIQEILDDIDIPEQNTNS